MKTLLLFVALWAISPSLIAQQLSEGKNDYSYFIRKAKIVGSNDTKIVITDKGDTTLVAHYQAQDVVNKTSQEFTKVYKGTPYFKNGWYKGSITTESGSSLKFLMAYNIEKNVVYIVENPKMDAVSIRPEEFSIEGHTFKQYENVFLETVYLQKNILLKGYECILSDKRAYEKTGYEPQGGEAEYEGEFTKYNRYFTIQDDLLKIVPIGKKALQVFGNKKSFVEKYVKANNINLKTEHGLIEAFKYYDSLYSFK